MPDVVPTYCTCQPWQHHDCIIEVLYEVLRLLVSRPLVSSILKVVSRMNLDLAAKISNDPEDISQLLRPLKYALFLSSRC